MTKLALNGSLDERTPLLCFDTCSLLDVMRDPKRENITLNERLAVMNLLSAAEKDTLLALIAPRVVLEYDKYCDKVQNETKLSIIEIRCFVSDIEELDALYGGKPVSGLQHLDGHHIRARSIAGRWLKAMHHVEQAEEIEDRARMRVAQGLAPAKRSGVPEADSIIFESYLHAIQELRKSGHIGSAVFMSSNTKDYLTARGSAPVVHSELNHVMKPLNFHYAQNYVDATNLLGL